MADQFEDLGVYRHPFYGVPLTVTYRCRPDYSGAELLAVHLPSYPDIDIKEGLSDLWISTLEANATYHEQNERGKAGTSPQDFEPFESLSSILGLSYLEAKDGESVRMIHLFGIRYAEDIAHCGRSVTELVNRSSVPNSYATEVHKGIKLAKFVKPV